MSQKVEKEKNANAEKEEKPKEATPLKLGENKILKIRNYYEPEKIRSENEMKIRMKNKKINNFQRKIAPRNDVIETDVKSPLKIVPKIAQKDGFSTPSSRKLELIIRDRPSPGKRKCRNFYEIRDYFELGMKQTPKKRRGSDSKNQL